MVPFDPVNAAASVYLFEKVAALALILALLGWYQRWGWF
jgi:hypothetical protein